MAYWLMKSEPEVFGIDHLATRPTQTEGWDGVRNYQARNFMREMKIGDQVFFYHSNTSVPGIVGIAEIVREAYPDHTAWDNPEGKYYDPKSTPDKPRWDMVDLRYVRHLKRTITLHEMKALPQLEHMPLVRKGNRLSVMPVTEADWQAILELEHHA